MFRQKVQELGIQCALFHNMCSHIVVNPAVRTFCVGNCIWTFRFSNCEWTDALGVQSGNLHMQVFFSMLFVHLIECFLVLLVLDTMNNHSVYQIHTI